MLQCVTLAVIGEPPQFTKGSSARGGFFVVASLFCSLAPFVFERSLTMSADKTELPFFGGIDRWSRATFSSKEAQHAS
jgi:hypothetical protein